MDHSDWATIIAGALGASVTLFGLLFAGRQLRQSVIEHRDAERWRRTEFAAKLIEQLNLDDELAFCARALDWGAGPLFVPVKYRPLFEAGTIMFQHNWTRFAEAVQVNLGPHWREPQSLTYRYCFDSFGAFLEAVQRHIELGNVQRSDLIGLRYYLDLVARAPYYDLAPASERQSGITSDTLFRSFLQQFYPDAWTLVQGRHLLPGR